MIKPAPTKTILAILREITITKITVLRILLPLPHAEFRKRPQTALTLLGFPVMLIAVTLIADP